MDYKTAYKKLREAKVEALTNSTNIRVGRRELNKALEALEIAEEISKIYEKIEEMEKEADKGIAIEKIGEAWGYEKVLELLKPLVEKRRD